MKRTTVFTRCAAVICGLAMLLAMAAPGFAAEGFAAAFTVTGGEASVNVYYTQDLTAPDETGVFSAVARSADTGEPDSSGDGQINFVVVPAEGCSATVTATGGYKNLKTVAENAYRLTKVTGDVAVTVTVTAAEATDASDPVITFTDSAATVTGDATGVSVNGTAVKINTAGTYTFTGSCVDGSIVVKKGVTGVTLILDHLTLSAHATAPITCNKGSGVTIVAAEGSVNNLSDDQFNNDDIYTDTTAYPDIENAVIKCKDGSNVTIGGTGTINVTANGKNGVKGGYDLYEEDEDGNATDTLLSTASLTVKDVTLNITCNGNDGLKSDKELNLLSGNITVAAVDDGVKSDYVLNIGAEGTEGPTVKVTKATEGIEGSVVNVYSGSVYVTATDDGVNAANGDIADRSADFAYNQYGGYVYVNCSNGDGIDSNGSATLAGGTLEVYAPSQGDGDPIDTEYGCAFSGATVVAVGHAMMQQSYSGAYVAFGGNGGMGGFGFGGMGGNTGGNIITAGGTVTVTDASGNTVYTARSTAPRNASYVVFASPDLVSGGSYTLNGSVTATAGASSGGNMGPGGQGGQGQRPDGQQPGNPGQRPGGRPGQGAEPADPTEGTPPQQPDAQAAYKTGDVDGDGQVTAGDARLALRASVGLESYAANSREAFACDADHDGQITSADARLILRASVGLETLTA